MALQFLGKDPGSEGGDSPTLYHDDVRDTFLVQSWKVTDQERLAQLRLPDHETVVELPRRMLQFFPGVVGVDRTDT